MSITNKLNQIKSAIYGKEVRGAIHDAIKECYDNATINHDNANMEVKMARGTHNTLNERLDKSDQKIDETNAQLSIDKNNLQHQINSIVLENGGDSNLEVAQSRISLDGNSYETLNSRINAIEMGVKTNKSPVFIEFERGNIDVSNGSLHVSTTVLRTKDFCDFGDKRVTIYVGDGYRCRMIAFDSANSYLWYGDWLDKTINLEAQNGERYKFIVSKTDGSEITLAESINVLFEYEYGVFCTLEEEIYDKLDKKADIPLHYTPQTLSLTLDKVHGTNGVDYDQYGGAYAFYNCQPGETIKVTGYGQSVIYPVVIFYDKNGSYIGKYGDVNTVYADHALTVPDNCFKLCLNAKDVNAIKLEALVPYDTLDDYLSERIASDEEITFELNNIYHRIMRNEKTNGFAWKPFDKTYFAFIIDDCNSSLPYFQELFAELQVPLSSATIVDRLSRSYQTSNGTKTVKEILDLIVANGGEVLAHYTGSPNDSSSDSDWLKVTREVKKTLTQNGYDVRGIIRADSTPNGSCKGEKFCRLYFDYSDGVGSSPQYDIKRWFLMGTTTLDEMKVYINQCITKPGFYPIAFHGNRSDEPMATPENMRAVINYIKSLGNDVEITTYRDIYDSFATTELGNRLSVLENK